ncbi:SDR family NAD(P)-dependent oxidoreductase [Spirillospora sp. NPDC127200]
MGGVMGGEQIAVVGVGCRLPGGITDLAGLWEVLEGRRTQVGQAPVDRFEPERMVDPAMIRSTKSYTAAGGFLEEVATFDADYFGISPKEAAQMDPQHRLLLETAVEAFDDAAVDAAALAGTRTAVFVGISDASYGALQFMAGTANPYTMAGAANSIAANRLSHFFDLRGPSMAIDTACSSSLVALDRACRALLEDDGEGGGRDGASGMGRVALACGVNVLLSPLHFVGFCQASMLSRSGRSMPFHAEADGFVRAEGAVSLVLKRLADAVADGDRIHGVIMGSGTGTDGRTAGIALPSATTQAELLRRVHRAAGVGPDQVSYLEAHGTGTPVGDPIECQAIGEALGSARTVGALPIGSVKANLGHLEPASGLAGVLKALLVLRHRRVPASPHDLPLNPGIDWTAWNLAAPDREHLLTDRRPVVGVSSSGFGGANAHVVLTAPPVPAERELTGPPADVVPLIASGRTAQAARQAAARLAEVLAAGTDGDGDLLDVAYTAARRETHRHRAVVLASTTAQGVIEAARRLADDPVLGEATARGRVGLVFAGNGSQWPGMGADLLGSDPVFAAEVAAVDAALAPHLGWSVQEEMLVPANQQRLAATEIAQPLLFAVQAGLTAMLRDQGVTPVMALGHSIGEVSAAYAAGALTMAQAAQVVAERSRAQALTAGSGRMAAVGLSRDRAIEVIAAYPGVEVAGVNSAQDVTLAGPEAQLKPLGDELEARGVFFRLLDLDYAFHSAAMQPARAPLMAGLQGLVPGGTATGPACELISTVTGAPITPQELDAGHWWGNMRDPVLFSAAVDHALAAGVDVLVEVGPHPVLATYLRRAVHVHQAGGGTPVAVLGTLRRAADGRAALRDTTAALMAAGVDLDWSRYFPAPRRVRDLPAYPWQRERHWNGHPHSWTRNGGDGRLDHPLLGERMATAEPAWQGAIEPGIAPWLVDHKLAGSVVFPATGYVEMALSAGRRVLDGPVELIWLDVTRPLIIPWDRAEQVRTQTAMSLDEGMVTITSTDPRTAEPRPHARGQVRALLDPPPAPVDLEALRLRCPEPADAREQYARLHAGGVQYGPHFHLLVALWRGDGEVLAAYRHDSASPADAERYVAHPALMDGVLQAGIPLAFDRVADGETFLPAAIEAVKVWRMPTLEGLVWVRDRTVVDAELCWDITVTDPDGQVTVEVTGARMRRLSTGLDATPRRQVTELRAAPHRALPAAPSPLPRNAALLASCTARIDRLRAALHQLGYPAAAKQALETLAQMSAETVAELLDDPTAAFDGDSLLAAGVLPRYNEAVRAVAALMERHGTLQNLPGDRWQLTAPRDAARQQLAQLVADQPQFLAQVLLSLRQAPRLAATWRGQHDPLEVLMTGGSQEFLEQFYDIAPICGFHNQVAAAVLRQIVEAWPAGRPLRILEVGAGTGGTTAVLLPLLPRERTRYDFTDLSPLFFTRAKHRFAAYDFVDYRVLDLNTDSVEQGFTAGGYDLVVAANALHTAADLRPALIGLRRLLAPGGRLVATETHDTETLVPIFGLLDSFWARDDRDLRPDSLLLARDRWPQVLAESGYTDIVQTGDDQPPVRDHFSVLLATAPAGTAPAPAPLPPASRPTLLITETPALLPLADGTAALLGDACQTAGPPADWRELLDRTAASKVVLLLGDGTDGDMDAAERNGAAVLVDRAVARIRLLNDAAAACVGRPEAQLWVVTRPSGALPSPDPVEHPADAALWGAARSLTGEYTDLEVVRVMLPHTSDAAARLARELVTPRADEDEIVLTAEGRYVPREVEYPLALTTPSGSFGLRVRRPGLSFETYWAARRLPAPGPDEVEIEVRAAALNYRDIMRATGLLPAEAVEHALDRLGFGMECAGVVTAVGAGVADLRPGDRVYGLAPAAFGDRAVTEQAAVRPIPEGMTFTEAATLPVAFLTVQYALGQCAQLAAGETVLVHGAAGGVGLAAIQYAHGVGATVIATAGNSAKRDYLRALGVEHVLDSRTLEFAAQVRRLTGDRGVDVVVNSLAGAAIDRSLELLVPGGRFIELGKRDIFGNKSLSLRPFRNNIAFFGVDLTKLEFDTGRAKILFDQVTDNVRQGHYRPLAYSAYPASRVGDAFALMQHSRHIGKVVVTFDPADPPPVEQAVTPPRLDPDGTYLVTGGLGGFGAATALWLADHGARHLALVSRRGADSPEAPAVLAELAAHGATATPYAADAADPAAMADIITAVDGGGHRLKGVVHAAMVLDDDLLADLTPERLRAVLAPKMAGAAVLDALTRDRDLDLFVLYSSYAATAGNFKQAAYAAGNQFMEALVRQRGSGLAAAWGHIADHGYVAREGLSVTMDRLGVAPITAKQALNALAVPLATGASVTGIGRYQWNKAQSMLPLLHRPRFALMDTHHDEQAGQSREDLLRRLSTVGPEEARQIVVEELTNVLAQVLQLDPERLDPGRRLDEYGLDSLMAAELLGTLRGRTGVEIPPMELLTGGGTIDSIAEALLLRLGNAGQGVQQN